MLYAFIHSVCQSKVRGTWVMQSLKESAYENLQFRTLSDEERIRGVEFRGMSYAIYDQKDIGIAFDSFLEAKQLRQSCGNSPVYDVQCCSVVFSFRFFIKFSSPDCLKSWTSSGIGDALSGLESTAVRNIAPGTLPVQYSTSLLQNCATVNCCSL